jgi:hypothetical protein
VERKVGAAKAGGLSEMDSQTMAQVAPVVELIWFERKF